MKRLIKKIITICIVLLFCITLTTGCTEKEDKDLVCRQVKVLVANDEKSTITYCDDYVKSASGCLYVTNNYEDTVSILMVRQDKGRATNDMNEEFSFSLEGGETKRIESIDINVPYEVGCRSDAPEGTEIQIIFEEASE